MPLPINVESIESVPEAARGFYKEVDGKFTLDVDGYEDPVGLKSALEKERLAAKTALQKEREAIKNANAWQALGKSPAEIEQIIAKQREFEEQQMISKGEGDKIHAMRTEAMKADYEKRLAETKALAEKNANQVKAFQGRVLDESLRAAISDAGLHKFAVDDAVLVGRTIFGLSDDASPVAMGADGEPVLGKDGKTPLTPTEWLESMKEKKPHWWPANASGGGSRQSNGTAFSKLRAEMTALEKSQYITKHGKDAFLALA